MSALVLIVRLAGQRVAIRAEAVLSVVELDEITPVPRAADHVAGLAALRSRVLTVIDPYKVLGVARPSGLGAEAVVVEVEGYQYAVTVESVEDVLESHVPSTLNGVSVGGPWSRVAAGTIEAGGDLLLLVDTALLVGGGRALAA